MLTFELFPVIAFGHCAWGDCSFSGNWRACSRRDGLCGQAQLFPELGLSVGTTLVTAPAWGGIYKTRLGQVLGSHASLSEAQSDFIS